MMCSMGGPAFIQDTNPLPVYLEASFNGFGARVGKDYLYGFWDSLDSPPEFDGGCSHLSQPPCFEQLKPNINIYELWPFVLALKHWGPFFKNPRLHLITDNMQVLAMINTGRSTNRTCMAWIRDTGPSMDQLMSRQRQFQGASLAAMTRRLNAG